MKFWENIQLENLIPKEDQLTLGEGETDLTLYEIDDKDVFVKKEFQNPTGSFKDRSMAFEISKLKQMGINKAAISSSGNAAISALAYCKKADISLHIFVSNNIEEKKIKKLEEKLDENSTLTKSKRPKSDAIQFSKKNNIPNLRGSKDDDAIIGFKTISYELADQQPNIDAIFIPCSSGTSTLGIYHGYQDILKINPDITIPQIHIVQTQKIHPIAKEFDKDFLRMYVSLAQAISDRVALRKDQVTEAVNRTNGSGWVISDDEIRSALELSKDSGIDFESFNSVLSLAGYQKALRKGYTFENPCLLYSGT